MLQTFRIVMALSFSRNWLGGLLAVPLHSETDSANILRNLISNFRRSVNDAFFILGDSLASEIYMPTFRNPLCVTFS